ncbi:MAG: hypothetical protein JXQ73_20705 [Phycisphaerae bacterium]|nr:hypothetical protein [Phycisphaerae bacterium]
MAAATRLPRYVIIQHTFREHHEILRGRLDGRREVAPLDPFSQRGEVGSWQGIEIAWYSGPAGEPTLVPVLEQGNVEYVFSLGLAGSMSKALGRGDLVLPTASLRGDGLTDYWADPMLPAVADADALSAVRQAARESGIDLASGIFHTTPTLYREMDFIRKWSALGVVAIQMELAQHFLLAHLHGKKAAGLYVISDSPLAGEEIWRSGVELDETLSSAYERAVDIVLGAIRILSEEMI